MQHNLVLGGGGGQGGGLLPDQPVVRRHADGQDGAQGLHRHS